MLYHAALTYRPLTLISDFHHFFSALGPVFSLIIIGVLLKRFQFPNEAFWPEAERLTYFVLFPVLLILKIGSATLPAVDTATAILALVTLLLISGLVTALIAHYSSLDNAAQTSVFQGGVRFNTYVGLAAAAAVYGDAGLVWGAVFLAVMIPSINLLCILHFSWKVPDQTRSLPSSMWRSISRNPLILACLTGAVLNLTGIGIPAPAEPVMTLISSMALPLGLLAVGVSLNPRSLARPNFSILVSSAIKLLAYPILFIAIAQILKLDQQAKMVFLLFALLPTAPSAYILARQLKGDAELMASIISFQTIAAMLTMPVMITLLS